VTLSLMILLTVIAVGLLSLSAVSLRSSDRGEARARAEANARMAVILAIGELQNEAGDDRRITADASILGASAAQPQLVGVWSSWSPNAAAQPDQATALAYDEQKTKLFRRWLVSSPDPQALRQRDWALAKAPADDATWQALFSREQDGFEMTVQTVSLPLGGMAWAVSQENTKAKINVGGPEADADGTTNVALQVQRRPSLALSGTLKQPAKDWNLRASRLTSFNQVALDPDLITDDPAATVRSGASHTVHSQGLLTDAVRGGLKVDLSLGFELGDADFARPAWDGVPNPFRTPRPDAGFKSPASYDGQQALFKPLRENPISPSITKYAVASVSFRFFAAGVPTFDHLRSFYRIPHHLYGGDVPVVAEREADHVAAETPPAAANTYFPPFDAVRGEQSSLSVRPVLNRMIYLLSMNLDAQDQVQLVITPVISLWNPYNTRLEIEGAVAYPWMDLPFQLIWDRKTPGQAVVTEPIGMADALGKQFESSGESRQVDPYFFCEMTANGDGNTSRPIQFEPGEVRVFYPASATPIDFIRRGSNAQRTVRMRPAENLGDVNRRGGFQISMQQADGVANHGLAKYQVKRTDEIRVALKDISKQSAERGRYHYFVTLEDAARIRNPADSTRGQSITDVQILNFISEETIVASPWRTYDELKTGTPIPFGVLETYHRTANSSIGGAAVADLIYTTNPRQAAINHQLANGSFRVAPHFQSTLRTTASFDDAIQTSFDGRKSFWGPSHRSTGKAQLPFFAIPRQPPLSLAAFQHADLSSSTFAPANQFGNSWASAYLRRDKTALLKPGSTQTPEVPVYDSVYLANEALWDSCFFSGAAPRLRPSASGKPSNAWRGPIANVEQDLDQVVGDFVADPSANPLPNHRMRLLRGGFGSDDLVERLLDPAGCTRIAAHLAVDGAFNVNSTDVEAWVALLSGLRGESFQVEGGPPPPADRTALPRFPNPTGLANDNWNGFRTLEDAQIRALAESLVAEIRKRGPFLSLAEFVNRRIEDSELGRNGAIQAAIEATNLNAQAKQMPFTLDYYPTESQSNITADTGVGIPGYLTQADVLQSLAPVITCRSDTFTVRGYGEARDATGKVLARSWCEAVVQRMPDFVDPTDAADTAMVSLLPVNQSFGRRFEIISFRRLSSNEVRPSS
jgi:hypothetical protein